MNCLYLLCLRHNSSIKLFNIMTQKSTLKPLAIFITICIIAFSSVILFNYLSIDNSEDITVEEPEKQIKKIFKPATKHTELKNQPAEETTQKYTKEEIPTEIGKTINKELMYSTPEKIIEAITYYQSIGDEEQANEFVDYLLEKFPDFELN